MTTPPRVRRGPRLRPLLEPIRTLTVTLENPPASMTSEVHLETLRTIQRLALADAVASLADELAGPLEPEPQEGAPSE